ncbi:MAG TPA: PIN domain-containing protein [Nitrolancea sp.]|nr:PIN domain-containing protein [Nitrolancea sp.]
MATGRRTIRTFADSGVLIAAARGDNRGVFSRAIEILDDPDRVFVSSDFIRLELMLKPMFYRLVEEVGVYEDFFAATAQWVSSSSDLLERAYDYGCRYGLNAMDALHIAAANIADADEFVTSERTQSPLSRIPGSVVTVRSIHASHP